MTQGQLLYLPLPARLGVSFSSVFVDLDVLLLRFERIYDDWGSQLDCSSLALLLVLIRQPCAVELLKILYCLEHCYSVVIFCCKWITLESEFLELGAVGSDVRDLTDLSDPVVPQVQVVQIFETVEVLNYLDEVVIEIELF